MINLNKIKKIVKKIKQNLKLKIHERNRRGDLRESLSVKII